MSARDDEIESLEDALEQVERENTELKKQITTLRAKTPTPTPPKETTTMSNPHDELEAMKKQMAALTKRTEAAEARAQKLEAANNQAKVRAALQDALGVAGLDGPSAEIALELLEQHSTVNDDGSVVVSKSGFDQTAEEAVSDLRKSSASFLWDRSEREPASPRGSSRRTPAPTTPDGKTDWGAIRERFAGGLAVALDGADE